jgi:hypothetical protein
MSRPVFHDLRGRLARRGAKAWRGTRALVRTPALGVTSRLSSLPLVDGRSTTVVSLTSYQARLRSVHLTIESIGRGTVRPGRIILWVDPGVVVDDLPQELQRLRRRGLEIVPSPAPYGPHTKYFPYVMSEAPHHALLVTADDDSLYPRWWLASLQEAAAGSDDVVCFRAHRVRFGPDGQLAPYNSWSPVTDRDPSPLNFATGVSGVGYPPAFLDELVALGDGFAQTCAKADDVWLHYAAVRGGRRVRQLGPRPRKFPELLSTQATALHRVNTGQTANDAQIASTYSADVLDALRTASVAS